MSFYDEFWPALPTRTKMNPAHPEDDDFYDPGQIAYVFQKDDGKYRVWTSFGLVSGPYPNDELLQVGDYVSFRHDQTDKILAHGAKCIGIKDYGGPEGEGWEQGEIPDRKMAHWVAK